jgi:hypothetical protein
VSGSGGLYFARCRVRHCRWHAHRRDPLRPEAGLKTGLRSEYFYCARLKAKDARAFPFPPFTRGGNEPSSPSQGAERRGPASDRTQQKHSARYRPSIAVSPNFSPAERVHAPLGLVRNDQIAHARCLSHSGNSLAKSSLLGQAARAASRSAPVQSRASGDIAAYWRRASLRIPWCSW